MMQYIPPAIVFAIILGFGWMIRKLKAAQHPGVAISDTSGSSDFGWSSGSDSSCSDSDGGGGSCSD